MYEPESGLTVAIAVNQSATPKMPFELLQEHLVMSASP
jgi:hypothetical protein